MARKTTERKARVTNPQPKRAIDDNFVAPRKRKSAEKPVTLAEALAESGETLEELTAPAPAEGPKAPKQREAGMSNLAQTIRSHRNNYAPMLHPNGKKTQNNGDAVAVLLLPIPLTSLVAYGATRFGKRYDQLNPGHQRMCFGNLIRAAVKKGEADVMDWLLANQPKDEEGSDAE